MSLYVKCTSCSLFHVLFVTVPLTDHFLVSGSTDPMLSENRVTQSSHSSRYKTGQNHVPDFIGVEPSKKRKRRTSFTPQALELLNGHFERNTHPSGRFTGPNVVPRTPRKPNCLLSCFRHRNHWTGASARLRAGSDPNLVLQQAASAQEHGADDVEELQDGKYLKWRAGRAKHKAVGVALNARYSGAREGATIDPQSDKRTPTEPR